ncbi:TIGR02611 family protein [Mycobacterium crocinum]|uniref:TIGR02611 family protein n=1 Tax=Mycolicibacterium crocinum TaxID=388459 RepID=A0ABY3TY76_9MYCO|nr:TIGR02611 family protein [Mycolicibacterium crocinum]MCV7218596.1 TIGR02611 family protein [Mycolicibacterium crocinum]ULN43907.1 TIGR02611 family protein [Mycolicibacterium crocinum]
MTQLLHRWKHRRERLRTRPVADFAYRAVVGVVGLAVLAVGIVAIPYPGPGWAIVFVGLAILASEFYWAHRTLSFTKDRYDSAMGWFRGQGRWVQALGAVFTAAVVVATLWLLGAVGWSAGLLGFDHPALDSPIGLGA